MALRTVTPPGSGNLPLRRATSHPDGGPLPLDRLRPISPPGIPADPLRPVSPPGAPNMPLRAVSSHANTTGGVAMSAAKGGGGVGIVDPNYRPPVVPPTPPPSTRPPVTPPAPPNRTFEDPRRPSEDPRVRELLRALTGDKTADAATIARSAELEKLIAQLMRGEGIAVGDMSTDPAARAYAVAKQREAERMREAEAARIGATGVSGDSELAARSAQIREATGESIAANNAELTNRRKAEALATALSGANLSLSDLQRRSQERSGQSAERLALLQTLMAGDRDKREAYERERDRIERAREDDLKFRRTQEEQRYQERREAERNRLRDELERLELERELRKRRGPQTVPGPYGPFRYGPNIGVVQ